MSEGKDPIDFEVAAEKGGISYQRDSGINGSISVTCQNESELGQATHITPDGKTLTYSYGLGGGSGEGEGGGGDAAASFTVVIENSELNSLRGSSGFYLRQENVEDGGDALNVVGNITFSYDVPSQTLSSAEGDVKISEKQLATFGSGDSLVLKESTVHISVADNLLQGVSGAVNLTLKDSESEYLAFNTAGEGDFDVLNTTSFSGSVTVTILREKQLHDGGEGGLTLYMTPASEEGGGGISAKLTNNNISAMSGAIGFRIAKGDSPYFGGTVQGSYSAEKGAVSGSASITLLSDIALPEGSDVFSLKAGSGGTATVTNNAIDTLSGNISVGIKAPNQAAGGGEILLAAEGSVDVQNAVIKEFNATASCDTFQITNGLSISGLSGSASIRDNVLEDISGSATINYTNGDFTVTGFADDFEWKKNESGQDGFKFSGGMTITAFGGKLSGLATISYDALTNPNATPVVSGGVEMNYQINDWLKAKVGVRFEEGSGWDDPIIYGSLDADDVTLVNERQLFGYDNSNALSAGTNIGIVTVSAGVGFGVSLMLAPLKMKASAQLEDFHIKKDKGIPHFTADVTFTSGLTATASISPYVEVGVGLEGIIEAGLRVRGVAALNASAELSMGGKLEGSDEGLSGEVSLGFDLAANVSLSVIPSVYASLLNSDVGELDITKWDFDLGELFRYSWGKKFHFGDTDQSVEDDAGAKASMTPTITTDENVEAKKDVGADYAPTGETSNITDGPQIPDPSTIADEASQSQDGEGSEEEEGGGMSDKVQLAKDIGSALGDIGNGIQGLKSLVEGEDGLIGLIDLVIKLICGDITYESDIKPNIDKILGGVSRLNTIIAENIDFIVSLLPDWMQSIYNFFKNPPKWEDLLAKAVDWVNEKINALDPPLPRILAPVVDLTALEANKVAEIIRLLKGEGGFGDIALGILNILGFGFSSLGSIIDTIGKMGSVFLEIVQEYIDSGETYFHYKVNKGGGFLGIWDTYDYDYCVTVPGLFTFRGSDWGEYKALFHGMRLILGLNVEEQEVSSL